MRRREFIGMLGGAVTASLLLISRPQERFTFDIPPTLLALADEVSEWRHSFCNELHPVDARIMIYFRVAARIEAILAQ